MTVMLRLSLARISHAKIVRVNFCKLKNEVGYVFEFHITCAACEHFTCINRPNHTRKILTLRYAFVVILCDSKSFFLLHDIALQ